MTKKAPKVIEIKDITGQAASLVSDPLAAAAVEEVTHPLDHEPAVQETAKITRDTMIGDAAMLAPDAAEIMFSYGLHCFGCGMTAYETIEQGCSGHGMADEEIDALVDELNESVERGKGA